MKELDSTAQSKMMASSDWALKLTRNPMKTCDYCGRENDEDAAQCHGCGTPFVAKEPVRPPPLPGQRRRVSPENKMIAGALWCFGGILTTLISYASAVNNPYGGSYMVALGAIVFGSYQFVEGVRERDNRTTAEDVATKALAYGTQLEIKGRIPEALAVYREVAETFPNTLAGHDAKKSLESLLAKLK